MTARRKTSVTRATNFIAVKLRGVFIIIVIFLFRYFKQKAEKENQRKRKTSDSDDETSEKATNFGTDKLLVPLFTKLQCFNLDFISALFTDNIQEERSSVEFNFAR